MSALKKEVKRFNPMLDNMGHDRFYVLAEDYDSLLADRDALKADAELFRRLRNIPKSQLGAPNVPCVAVPEGIRTGRYVTGEDLDAAMQGEQPCML